MQLKENEELDKKLKLLALVVALLMSASLLSTCSASRRTIANFELNGSGGCLIFGDLVTPDGPFEGIGTGTLHMVGTSDVQLMDVSESPPGRAYETSRSFRVTQQQFTASWEGHTINLRFMVRDINGGLFLDNFEWEEGVPRDYMYILSGSMPNSELIYRGTSTDATGTHSVSGTAWIFVDYYDLDGGGIGTMLFIACFGSNNSILELVWFSDGYSYTGVQPPLNVPAANVQCQVVVNN